MRDTRIDVGRLIDGGRWSVFSAWLIFLTALTIVFDGIDNQLLGVVIPTIMREWSVPRAAFAPVVSLGYVGMMLGGALAGVAGDRVGRRTALLGCMVVFGVMTLAAATTSGTVGLAVLRLLAGVGLGGAMPNAAALAAEYVPRRQRPIAVTLTIVCVPLGATLAGVLGIRALPAAGWRTLFIIGGIVPVVAALFLRQLLPESPLYLTRHKQRWPELEAFLRRMGHQVPRGAEFVASTEEAGGRPSGRTLLQPNIRRDTIALWGSFFSCLLAVYLGFSWLTSLLTGAGFDPATANSGITAFNLGGVVGALLGGAAIARVGSRRSMLVMAAGAIAGAISLSLMTISPASSFVLLLALLTWTGGLINAVQTTMYALAAHIYPGPVRATGVGSATSIGRLGAIVSGFAGAWAIDSGGSRFYFALIAIAMSITFACLAMIGRHVPPRLEIR